MSWIILFLAGLFEVCWAVGLKYTDGFTRPLPTLLTVAAMIVSIGLLGLAMKELPLGTAYAIWTGVGAVGTVAGAQLLVDNGSALASMCGVSDRVISVTIIAIGTSLPELVTTLTAIAKKQGSLSAGNIIGANIIDLTLILPVCALIYGRKLPASPTVAMVDIPACLIIGILSVVPTLITKKFSRWQGVLMLAAYAVYIVLSVIVMA